MDVKRITKIGQHPCARQRAMVLTEAVYEYIAERQLLGVLQVRGRRRLGPGRVIAQRLVNGVWPARLRAKVSTDV